MSSVRELHHRAMENAEEAFIAKRNGELQRAKELFEKAFEDESKAADIVAWKDVEPTRSVLHKSAAVLGKECGNLAGAKRLALEGLRGNPPLEIRQELEELLQRIEEVYSLERERLVSSRYSLPIGGKWTMSDLSDFMHLYKQVYFFEMWALGRMGEAVGDLSFQGYPMKGGFSYLNAYDRIARLSPQESRIDIVSMQYSSPGWIGLNLYAPAALEAGLRVRRIGDGSDSLSSKYEEIHRMLSKYRLLGDSVDDMAVRRLGYSAYVKSSLDEFSMLMGIDQAWLVRVAGEKIKALKLLLSYFRRVRSLHGYVRKDMVKL